MEMTETLLGEKGVEGFITHIVVKSVLWYTVIVEGAGFGGNDPGDVRSQ